MFILSHLSRAQFRLNKSSEEPEHATLAVIAPLLVRTGWTTMSLHSKKAEIEVLDVLCQERFKFGAGDTVVCKTAWSLCNHACFRGARKTDAVDW